MKIEKIIVVEDEIYLLETMVEILKEDLGYHVITATSKEKTLQKAHTELPDLILFDVELEEREDGITICQGLKVKKNKTYPHCHGFCACMNQCYPKRT